MRLRVSGHDTGQEYDLNSVMAEGDDLLPPDITDGALMQNFIEAVMDRNPVAVAVARAELVAARGAATMIDAAAVIAAFNAYPRVADATGIPLEDAKATATQALRGELGLEALK
jgi:hypothetical protein